jgi:hypothetical protein
MIRGDIVNHEFTEKYTFINPFKISGSTVNPVKVLYYCKK